MKKSKIILSIVLLLLLIVSIICTISYKDIDIFKNIMNILIIINLVYLIIAFFLFIGRKPKINNKNTSESTLNKIKIEKLEDEYHQEYLKSKINELKNNNTNYIYKCTYCNSTYDNEIKFCPSCGAKTIKTTKEE